MTTKTSHRPSFSAGNNSFWSADASGFFIFDGEYSRRLPPADFVAKFQAHARDGYHPDCIHCLDKEAKEALSVTNSILDGQDDFDAAAAETWPGVEKRGIASGKYPDDLVTARHACDPSCPLTQDPGDNLTAGENAGFGQMGPL